MHTYRVAGLSQRRLRAGVVNPHVISTITQLWQSQRARKEKRRAGNRCIRRHSRGTTGRLRHHDLLMPPTLADESQASQVLFSPAGLVFDNLLERANRQDLPRAVEVDGDASTVRVLKKTGCTFAPCKGKPVTLECRDQATCGQAAERRVINRHGIR